MQWQEYYCTYRAVWRPPRTTSRIGDCYRIFAQLRLIFVLLYRWKVICKEEHLLQVSFKTRQADNYQIVKHNGHWPQRITPTVSVQTSGNHTTAFSICHEIKLSLCDGNVSHDARHAAPRFPLGSASRLACGIFLLSTGTEKMQQFSNNIMRSCEFYLTS